ncbi:FAD-dependent oxidoreductase [Nonomuraea sp. NPDC046570]|uniref:FAD-binding oxidoreductase n=1 Tax=Nonomuraea sp. NPDC046570 TaxID=3155255 RepID=UPI0033F646EE
MSTTTTHALGRDLRRVLTGKVHTPGEGTFAAAAAPWNRTVGQVPLAVVEAADAPDVAALLAYAHGAGVPVSVQPTGHGAAGDTRGTILLRTGHLNQVTLDVGERLARVGAGAGWQAVLNHVSPHHLTALAGSSPVVSVAGYTLGGGLSWFGRRHGYAAHTLRSADVITADGTPARVDASSDPDLWWALRGGGGGHAVVTALELTLAPAPLLYGGRMTWAVDRAPEVMDAFRQITADAPDDLSLWFTLLRLPPAAGGHSVVTLDVAYLGSADSGRELLREAEHLGDLISDTRAPRPVAELGAICAEPTDPRPSLYRGELLTELDDATAAALLASSPIAPLAMVQLRHLGGALAQPVANPGACGRLTEPFLLYTLGLAADQTAGAAIACRQQELFEGLATATGRKPYTYLAPGEEITRAFGVATLDRLRKIKQDRDPDDIIRAAHPFPKDA